MPSARSARAVAAPLRADRASGSVPSICADMLGGAHEIRFTSPPSWSVAMMRRGCPPARAAAWSDEVSAATCDAEAMFCEKRMTPPTCPARTRASRPVPAWVPPNATIRRWPTSCERVGVAEAAIAGVPLASRTPHEASARMTSRPRPPTCRPRVTDPRYQQRPPRLRNHAWPAAVSEDHASTDSSPSSRSSRWGAGAADAWAPQHTRRRPRRPVSTGRARQIGGPWPGRRPLANVRIHVLAGDQAVGPVGPTSRPFLRLPPGTYRVELLHGGQPPPPGARHRRSERHDTPLAEQSVK